MQIRQIVTCTDFSDAALAGVATAFDFARQFDVPVKLLHVFPHPISVDPELAPSTLAEAQVFLDAARDVARKRLDAMLAKYAGGGVKGDCEVLEGVPYAAITDACTPDALLVVSTHGRSGAKRLLLGSVAERLVRCAPCPVLTVPANKSH